MDSKLDSRQFIRNVLAVAKKNEIDCAVYANGKRGIQGNIYHALKDVTTYKATFKDLYDYIRKCKRDEFGVHNFSTNSTYNYSCDVKWVLHIYNGYRQVNFCYENDPNLPSDPKGAILFRDDDKVELYKTDDSGHTDYNDPYAILSINDTFNLVSWSHWLNGDKGVDLRNILELVLGSEK